MAQQTHLTPSPQLEQLNFPSMDRGELFKRLLAEQAEMAAQVQNTNTIHATNGASNGVAQQAVNQTQQAEASRVTASNTQATAASQSQATAPETPAQEAPKSMLYQQYAEIGRELSANDFNKLVDTVANEGKLAPHELAALRNLANNSSA